LVPECGELQRWRGRAPQAPEDWTGVSADFSIVMGSLPPCFLDHPSSSPELEWLANITNAKPRRAYRNDVGEIFGLRRIARSGRAAHRYACACFIAWRKYLEERANVSDVGSNRFTWSKSIADERRGNHSDRAGKRIATLKLAFQNHYFNPNNTIDFEYDLMEDQSGNDCRTH
jgi:hypothetical protein